jgi:hypothetical protein
VKEIKETKTNHKYCGFYYDDLIDLLRSNILIYVWISLEFLNYV